MSKKEDQFIAKVSNEILRDKHAQEMGSKAIVERRTLENNEILASLREVIEDIAKNLQERNFVTKGLDYKGSLTVHVFASEVLRITEMVPLTVTGNLHPVLGDAALNQLRNSYLSDTGRRMQKKRSGL